MRYLLTILLLCSTFCFAQGLSDSRVFSNIGVLKPGIEGALLRHFEHFELKMSETTGQYESSYVFFVDNPAEYVIGIKSHNFMTDYDIQIIDHLDDEIIIASEESWDGYINVHVELELSRPYRIRIIGSDHDKTNDGVFYIKEKRPATL